jgi:hypothetical protein
VPWTTCDCCCCCCCTSTVVLVRCVFLFD